MRQFIISLDISNTKVNQIKYKVENNTLDFIISPKDGFFNNEDITSRSSGFKYDLIITLDVPDLESLGKIYDNDTEFFYSVPIINIDHNSSNEEFGQINLVQLTAVSTSEILFNLFNNYSKDSLDEDIATCLLAGMIAKTRSFKTQNITPTSLSIAAQLISMGAKREEIVNRLFRSRSLNVLKLWGRVLARLSASMDNQLVWSALSELDFEKTETGKEDLGDIIDELIINIPQIKVIVIIYEKKSGEKMTTNCLVHSVKNVDALQLVKEYNPSGTKKSAHIKMDKAREEAEKEIIDFIQNKLNKLPVI